MYGRQHGYRQAGGGMPPPPPGRQLVLPEPGDVGQMIVRGATSFAKNHKIISGSYILGILVILLIGSGTKLNYDQRRQYNQIMSTIDLQAEFDASTDYWRANEAYRATKGWFSCDGICQRNKQRMEEAKYRLDAVRQEGQSRMSDAKSVAGIFSREESMVEFGLRVLMNVLINFSIGLMMALVMFVIGLWSIVRSYQPNPLVAMLFFVGAACAAFSFVVTYLLAIYGAAAGGVYGVLKVAESNARAARIQGGGGQQAYMGNRPHYD
ncbi:MAG: hypothetical protein SGARI_000955 [Bacillariaceae sp.]